MKSNKGITIMSLVITLVVMLILASVVTYTGLKTLKNAQIQTLNTNMLLIQAKAKMIAEKHNFANTELIGDIVDDTMKQSLLEKGLIQETDEYRVWNKTTLDSQGLGDIKCEDNTYIVNYTKEEVIYTPGYKTNDGTIYYTLSETKTLVETGDIAE